MTRRPAVPGRDVEVVDVSPRDGLQNDPGRLEVEEKVALIERLLAAGVPRVEVGSFVRADRVPAMAGTDEVARRLDAAFRHRYTCLVPNERGYGRAVEAGLGHVRVVVATSAVMNRRNFGVDPSETLEGIRAIAARARRDGVGVGALLATAFGCPYEGRIAPGLVAEFARELADLGVDEIVLADTTGLAVPPQVRAVVERVAGVLEADSPPLGLHLHNTRNTGYANAYAGWLAGVRRFDASLGGIGGCPFAPRSTGNIATEDLVHMFERSGQRTGVDLDVLIDAAGWLEQCLGHGLPGLVARAGPAPREVFA